jgi:calcineurin-like phosphoesterase family protein
MKDFFYKPLKINKRNNEILFWGCLHYGHDPKWQVPIWKSRGYESSQEHDLAIIQNWNSKASKETTGFILGDIVFGYDGEEKFKKLIKDLNFKQLFVMSGNHQSGWKQVFESCEKNILKIEEQDKEVIFVPNYLELIVNGQFIVTSHFPIISWNLAGKDSWMLFSHVHGSLSKSELGNMYLNNGGKVLEVSVESSRFPFTYGEIFNFMKNKSKFKTDHHESETI